MPETDLLRLLLDLGGLLGMVSLLGVALIRGWLVPGPTVDRIVGTYQCVIRDKDRQIVNLWETNRIEAARGDVLADGQRQIVGMLTELARE